LRACRASRTLGAIHARHAGGPCVAGRAITTKLARRPWRPWHNLLHCTQRVQQCMAQWLVLWHAAAAAAPCVTTLGTHLP
jgi:hypothetical protein